MKRLLKILALWFVKISGINLVEPYTLEHLKRMIHNLTADISTFKHTPFFVKFEAINHSVQFYAAFLVDAANKEDVDKIMRSISNSLALKDYYLLFHDVNDICEYTKPATDTIERHYELADDNSFGDRVHRAIERIGKSQYFLNIDILSGTTEVINRTAKLPVETKPNYPGIVISVTEY
jgi:hypothetical protein